MCAAALAALLPLALSTPAAAATDQVDQSLALNSWLGSQSGVAYMAQTFTAGVSGRVDRVSLPVNTLGWGMFSVSLTGVGSNAMPTATVLGSSPTASGYFSCCGLHDFWLSSSVPVTSGTQYAIVVHPLGGTVRWMDAGTAHIYTAGRQFVGSSPSSWFTTSHWDFGFQEWVLGGAAVNQSPVAAATNAAVSVSEGAPASNSGTCSDPDGDAVTLKASTGSVSACGAGAWTWSQPAGDEAPAQTVTITADDGHGLTSSTSFTVAVNGVDPTAQILTDPPSVPEGSSVPFTGGATSPDPADNAAGFTYTWTVSVNGAQYATGSGASWSFIPADDGTYTVKLTATDDGGMPGSTSMTLLVTNVAPVAAINTVGGAIPLVTTAGETLGFHGSFTDADTADHYTITWNFGDGDFASGTDVTHQYAAAGTYAVTFTVSDGEGGVSTATRTVTVQTTQQALASIAAYVQTLSGLNDGQKNSLLAKLSAAQDSAARGDQIAASNQLNAFLHELRADTNSGKLSPDQAATLGAAVDAVQAGLGTLSRILVWRPLVGA